MQHEITSVTSRAQQVRVAPRSGTWLWIWQRLTAYGLLFFLPIHLYFMYFAQLDVAGPLTAAQAAEPFNVYPFIFALNEFLLLICALFHGLNGLRNMLFDWLTHTALRRVLTVLLLLLGIGFAVYGTFILWSLANVSA